MYKQFKCKHKFFKFKDIFPCLKSTIYFYCIHDSYDLQGNIPVVQKGLGLGSRGQHPKPVKKNFRLLKQPYTCQIWNIFSCSKVKG